MEYKDYYKILGLERGATQEEIKRAFRKLARKLHPDVSKEPTAEARFTEISEAYEVPGDAEKRAAYDQLGEEWEVGPGVQAAAQLDAGFEFSGADFEQGEFKAKRLERDLGLNLPGVALALDLLDQMDEMRTIERQKEIPPQRR